MCKEAYIRIKDKTDLAGMVKIDIPRSQYIHVYVWDTLAAMYKNTDFDRDNYGACYAASVHTKRLFGEIHLVKGSFGAGLFAHEFQHFVLHWMHEYGYPHGREKEEICLMVHRATATFWGWFHKTEGEWTQ